MPDWDRIQRLETDLAKAHARIRDLEALVASDGHATRTHEKLRAAVHRMNVLMDERETARKAARELEAEAAACRDQEHHSTWWQQ